MKNLAFIKPLGFTILAIGFSLTQAKAQDFSLAVGQTLTKFDYKSPSLTPSTFFKTGSGQSLRAGLAFAQPASRMRYEVSLAYNQYNAVGNTETTSFNYQTDYLGLRLGAGPQINFGPNLHLQTKATFTAQSFLHGNQQLGNQYIDLKAYQEFTKLQMFIGYDIELSHKVNAMMSGFVSVQGARTLHSSKTDVSVLDFSTRTFALGIKINH